MRTPRPFGLANKGYDPTERDMAFIKYAVADLCNYKELCGLESLQQQYVLPDGGIATVQNMGGILRVITNKPEPEKEDVSFINLFYVPFMFSGAVVETEDGIKVNLTETTKKRLVGYRDKDVDIDGAISIQRLAISKHTGRFPTLYSGSMSEVVQISNGYGIQDFSQLPNNKVDRAVMRFPDSVEKAIKKEVDGITLPAYTGIPPSSGLNNFQYRFLRTDLISFSNDGMAWLVRVSNDGVISMPLPMIPATTTKAFRDYIEENRDDEILKILDKFGGMPSGEGFPSDDLIDDWIKAGAIVRVATKDDLSDFYSNSSLYHSCSWSCDRRGRNLANTCLESRHEEVFPSGRVSNELVGHFFTAMLNLGEAGNKGILPRKKIEFKNEELKEITFKYISELLSFTLKNHPSRLNIIRYKIRRVEQQSLLERAIKLKERENYAKEYEYWIGISLEPISEGSFYLKKEKSSSIVRPGRKKNIFGFHVPSENAYMDYRFFEGDKNILSKNEKIIDQPIFAYFDGDELKTVNYIYSNGDNVGEKIGAAGNFYINSGVENIKVDFFDDNKNLSQKFSKQIKIDKVYPGKQNTYGYVVRGTITASAVKSVTQTRPTILPNIVDFSRNTVCFSWVEHSNPCLIYFSDEDTRRDLIVHDSDIVGFDGPDDYNMARSWATDEKFYPPEFNPKGWPHKDYYTNENVTLLNRYIFRTAPEDYQRKPFHGDGGIIVDSMGLRRKVFSGAPNEAYILYTYEDFNTHSLQSRAVNNFIGDARYSGYWSKGLKEINPITAYNGYSETAIGIPLYFIGVVNK